MAVDPSKSDIQTIFKRLRSIPTNKQCFDCGANNPTWASVTYGVFLCIDCSATHRSLGVHLTFIRSTQLDTSWTWLQLRAMQTGGNANATAFFRQHGCTTSDAQAKYNSRVASMYRDKLHHLASKAMQAYGTKAAPKLHLDSHGGLTEANSPDQKDVDFFKEHHDSWQSDMSLSTNTTNTTPVTATQSQPIPVTNGANGEQKKPQVIDDGQGPSVDHALSVSPTEAVQKQEPRKSTIGARKPAKKSGLGGAKKSLGAQKVKKNFSELEQEAQQKDREREQLAKAMELQQSQSKEEEARKMASLKLAYKDLSLEDKKRAETAKKMDPKKAEQLERLGMAYSGGSRGISHSVLTDMQTIEQETPTVSRNTFDDRYSSRSRPTKDFDDDFEILGGFSSGPPKYDSPFGLKNEDRYTNSKWGSSGENGSASNVIEDIPSHKPSDDRSRSRGYSKTTESSAASDSDAAQKKFGSAKAISSDMYFGNKDTDLETKQTLAKFDGSSGISSADFYGGGPGSSGRSMGNKDYYESGTDLTEIKDSVRQGVNKVAGRLSSIANGVISSLQDNYG